MKNIIGIFNATQNKWIESSPFIYTTNGWLNSTAYIYTDNAWKQVGSAGTFMIPFVTSNGEFLYTSDGKMFLVKEHE